MCDPAGVDCCTGSAYDAAQEICELFDGSEALGAANSTSACDDDVCAFKVDDLAASFLDDLKESCTDFFGSYMEIFFDNFSLVLASFGFLRRDGQCRTEGDDQGT